MATLVTWFGGIFYGSMDTWYSQEPNKLSEKIVWVISLFSSPIILGFYLFWTHIYDLYLGSYVAPLKLK